MRGLPLLPWPVAEVACGRERLQPSCRVCACGVVCTCVAWFFFVLGVLCACVCTRMRGSLRGVSCFSIPSPSSRAMSSGHRGRKRETEVVAEAKKKKKILRPAFCCLQNLSSQLSVFFPLLYHSLHSCFFKWNKTWEEPGRAPASMAGARSSRSDRHRSFRSLLSLQVVCSTPQCSHYAEDANRFMRYDLVSGL